ncbi:MAG: iron chelate uptake ABC transporter family permease subunit, partial [Agrococcus casei]
MTPSPTRAAMGRTHRRAVIVGTASAALLVAVSLVTMTVGDYPLSPAETIQTLFGGGSQRDQYIIFEVRLPRLLMAVLCGVGLGASGAIMQALLRNPLASPELLGITGGASVAAVAGTLMFGLGGLALVGLAFAGGLVIAAVLLVAA